MGGIGAVQKLVNSKNYIYIANDKEKEENIASLLLPLSPAITTKTFIFRYVRVPATFLLASTPGRPVFRRRKPRLGFYFFGMILARNFVLQPCGCVIKGTISPRFFKFYF